MTPWTACCARQSVLARADGVRLSLMVDALEVPAYVRILLAQPANFMKSLCFYVFRGPQNYSGMSAG